MLLERDPLVVDSGPRETSNGLAPPRRATLKLWVSVVALVHFDRGAALVAGMGVTSHWMSESSFSYAVSLLAWHSVGLALGNGVFGALLQRGSAKALMVVALSISLLCTLLLGLEPFGTIGLLGIAVVRGFAGFAAAMPLVYLPVWVDEFSLAGSHGFWMSVLQAGAPLGQFFGILGGVGAEVAGRGWRFALLAQAAMLFPVTVRIATVPLAQVDLSNATSLSARLDSATSLSAPEGWKLQNVLRELREMLQGMNRNPLTMSLSSTLCLLHFIAAFLALWGAPYLAESAWGAPSPAVAVVLLAVALCVLPTLGTLVGALVCERQEGFKAGMHAVALRLACGFVALGALCGPLSSALEGFYPRLLLLGVWLFSAGALLPICVGLLMTSMPSYLRSFSAASMFLMLHVLSFAAAPLLLTLLMTMFVRPAKGLDFGVGLALWATVLAALLLLVAYAREPKGSGPEPRLSGVDDLNFSEVSYEVARRRVSTPPL